MATVIVEVKKKGSAADDVPLPVSPQEKIEAYKKACEEDSDDDEARFNVMKRGPSIQESNEARTIKMEMTGLGEEDVKVIVVNQMLVMKAADERKNGNKLTMFVSDDEYQSDETTAVMENGVLTVVVPKIKKPEEINDASTHDAVKD